MFLPNLMPANTHHLWLDDSDKSSKFLRRRRHLGAAALSSKSQRQKHQQQYQVHQTVRDGTGTVRGAKFAPSLSSYSSACVGATVSTDPSSDEFSSEIEARLAYLDSIKTYGYSFLKPLGIGRTMQTMIDEQNMQLQENGNTEYTESVTGTAENLLRDTHGNTNAAIVFQDASADEHATGDSVRQLNLTGNSIQPQAEGTGFTTNNTTANTTGNPDRADVEVDLDANISDHDDDEEEDLDDFDDEGYGEEYLSVVFDENNEGNDQYQDQEEADEEFMAAEEEYEYDDNNEGNVELDLSDNINDADNDHDDGNNIPTAGANIHINIDSARSGSYYNNSTNHSNTNNSVSITNDTNNSNNINSGYFDSELNSDLIRMRASGTRNISTSTQISGFNLDQQFIDSQITSSEHLNSGNHPGQNNSSNSYNPRINSLNPVDLFHLNSEMLHLFSRNTTHNEENDNSYMDVE